MQGCRYFLDNILSVGISGRHCLSGAARCEVGIPGVESYRAAGITFSWSLVNINMRRPTRVAARCLERRSGGDIDIERVPPLDWAGRHSALGVAEVRNLPPPSHITELYRV